jgi:UDP-N-acetylmuramyl pentapeptide phosphotransferase/UDP-N-acetylglucosamine-1-phosphate transferase
MNAKAVIHVGIALICFGIAALTYPSVTRTSEVIEIADQRSSTDTRKNISVSPLMGGLLLVGGVVLVVAGAKTSPRQ